MSGAGEAPQLASTFAVGEESSAGLAATGVSAVRSRQADGAAGARGGQRPAR